MELASRSKSGCIRHIYQDTIGLIMWSTTGTSPFCHLLKLFISVLSLPYKLFSNVLIVPSLSLFIKDLRRRHGSLAFSQIFLQRPIKNLHDMPGRPAFLAHFVAFTLTKKWIMKKMPRSEIYIFKLNVFLVMLDKYYDLSQERDHAHHAISEKKIT